MSPEENNVGVANNGAVGAGGVNPVTGDAMSVGADSGAAGSTSMSASATPLADLAAVANEVSSAGITPDTASTTGASGGLSMADSMDSAADNLTSAGLAAKEQEQNAIDLGEIGASDPSAMMARPDEPLVPAAPVPGSIGSAVSGPAVGTPMPPETASPVESGKASVPQDSVIQNSAASMMAAEMAAASTAPAAAPATPAASSASPTAMMDEAPTVTGAEFTAQAAAEAPASAPFNPFAMNTAMGPKSKLADKHSSSAVPQGSQPQTSRFSEKVKGVKGNSKVLTIILAVVAALMTVLAVIFMILWIKESNKDPKIIYVTPVEESVDEPQDEIDLSCTKAADESVTMGIANLLEATSKVNLSFVGGTWVTYNTENYFVFGDEIALTDALPIFDGLVATLLNSPVEQAEGDPIGAWYSYEGNELSFTRTVNVEKLPLTDELPFEMPRNESGEIERNPDIVKAYFEGQGFVCIK